MERVPMLHRPDGQQDDRRNDDQTISRRIFLKQMRWAPVLFLPAPVMNPFVRSGLPRIAAPIPYHFPFADLHTDTPVAPHYPANSPLDAVLRLAAPGTDEYLTEGYAFELAALLEEWSQHL
jgi:hypothetical protein